MAGKGGGAWKVAYADFVTAMMAFFLVMWITAQNKPVKESIAQYFTDPYGEASETPTGKPAAGEGGTPGRPVKLQIFRDLDPTRTTGTMVLFAEASGELDQQAIDQLTALVPQLVGKPNKIELRGHASRRPLPAGSPMADRWELSFARCKAVRDFLIDRGIKADRFRLSQAAEFEPYTLRQEPEWRAQNSRVEISALSEHAHPLDEPREDRGGFFGHAEEKAEKQAAPHGGHGHGKKSSHGAHGGKKAGHGHAPKKSSHGHH